MYQHLTSIEDRFTYIAPTFKRHQKRNHQKYGTKKRSCKCETRIFLSGKKKKTAPVQAFNINQMETAQ